MFMNLFFSVLFERDHRELDGSCDTANEGLI